MSVNALGIEAVARYIEEARGTGFLLVCHINPDGDALGSVLALAMGLKATGRRAHVFSKDGVTPECSFLPGAETVLTSLDGLDTNTLSLLLMDCNTPGRAGIEGVPFLDTAVVDHHRTQGEFGRVRWIDPGEPATGMMVFKLLGRLGVGITPSMATNIYTAIAIDTGTFRYPNTTGAALEAAARLVEAGARPGEISDHIYNGWGEARFRLLQMAFSGLWLDRGICIMPVTLDMFGTTGTIYADTDNFVNYPLMMRDVRVSAAVREVEPGLWRVSLRSKGRINVAAVAEGFGGGGHVNAAGCNIEGTFEEVRGRIVQAVDGLKGF